MLRMVNTFDLWCIKVFFSEDRQFVFTLLFSIKCVTKSISAVALSWDSFRFFAFHFLVVYGANQVCRCSILSDRCFFLLKSRHFPTDPHTQRVRVSSGSFSGSSFSRIPINTPSPWPSSVHQSFTQCAAVRLPLLINGRPCGDGSGWDGWGTVGGRLGDGRGTVGGRLGNGCNGLEI